jgi:hypothetical protein
MADAIVGQLPEAGDLGIDVPSGWIQGYGMLNTFLPISEALAFALIYVTAITAAFGARLAVLIWHLIPKPGVGT